MKDRSAAVPAALSVVNIRSRGYLPHAEAPDSIYFITFRLGDSLPAHVLAELKNERRSNRSFDQSDKILRYLDASAGECHLKVPRVASMVCDALHYFDRDRYRLLAWCIMPNHVHLVFAPHASHHLEDIMHSLKSFTAHKANALLGRKGKFWQREYYDRVIHDPDEYSGFMNYVVGNPDTAGLRSWPWKGYEGRDGLGAPHFYDAGFPMIRPQ